jgi:rubrerythrin
VESDGVLANLVGNGDLILIRNLETAFEEEMRNCTVYKAYAARADEEGYHGLASLFRATARAEHIHASNHARLLRQMGGSTLVDIPEPRLKSTLDNLKSALVDQKFEVNSLYPTFFATAASLFDSTAVRSFQRALEADKSHARLFSDAIAHLSADGKSRWVYTEHDFYVCALCGYITEGLDAENCPACNYLSEKFEKIR